MEENKWISVLDGIPADGIRVLAKMNNGWVQVMYKEDGKWILLHDEYFEPEQHGYNRKVVEWKELD